MAYARWVSDHLSTGTSVTELRRHLDESMATAWVDRETFGMDAAVLDALAPAKPRPRGPRPTPRPRRSA